MTSEETSSSESFKALTISHIKSLPIWAEFESFRVKIQLLEHDTKSYLDRLDRRVERLEALPKLNLDNKIKCYPPNLGSKDLDIVRVYKKSGDLFKPVEGNKKQRKSIFKHNGSKTDSTNESLAMLEAKLQAGEEVYAIVESGKPWVRCKVVLVFRKPRKDGSKPITTIRLRGPEEQEFRTLDRNKYSIARVQNHGEMLKASKRVIAGESPDHLMPGTIGQEPAEFNKHRYMVLMDDLSANYFRPDQIYPIFGQSSEPYQDSRYLGEHNEHNWAYLRAFFSAYPKRKIIMVSVGQSISIDKDGTVVPAKVLELDCDVMKIQYEDGGTESVHRGSNRLMKRTNPVAMEIASKKKIDQFYYPLMRSILDYSETSINSLSEKYYNFIEYFDQQVTLSSNTARKSTGNRGPRKVRVRLDGQAVSDSRDTIETLDRVDDTNSHKCTPRCLQIEGVKTEIQVVDIIDEFRDVSDLKVPLLLGWKRKLVRLLPTTRNGKSKVIVAYDSPCSKTFIKPYPLRRHLAHVNSKLDIDYFSFDRDLDLNPKFGEFEAYHFVPNIAVEKATNRPLENKNICLINQFTEEELPVDFEYRNETFPHPILKSKGFSFNQEFKSCCTCEDDCFQRTVCDCHRLNDELFGIQTFNRGQLGTRSQYNHKRLYTQVATGIFECNSFCGCSSRCANRVVQNGIRFRLQVRKTLEKGWGVVTLDDIPAGAFICTYSAELLDDADQYGDSDMYYADLDFITMNEEQKLAPSDDDDIDEGIDGSSEDDNFGNIANKNGKRKKIVESDEDVNNADDDDEEGTTNGSTNGNAHHIDDDVILDSYIPRDSASRYPRRERQRNQGSKSRGQRQARFKRIHDLLSSHDYTLDARMQGNVGRFFNHSCDPNSFVQNVFIETHDLRFPVVAFFALRTIKAMNEITWNYNYKMGSIEGREMACKCGAPHCKGRIL